MHRERQRLGERIHRPGLNRMLCEETGARKEGGDVVVMRNNLGKYVGALKVGVNLVVSEESLTTTFGGATIPDFVP